MLGAPALGKFHRRSATSVGRAGGRRKRRGKVWIWASISATGTRVRGCPGQARPGVGPQDPSGLRHLDPWPSLSSNYEPREAASFDPKPWGCGVLLSSDAPGPWSPELDSGRTRHRAWGGRWRDIGDAGGQAPREPRSGRCTSRATRFPARVPALTAAVFGRALPQRGATGRSRLDGREGPATAPQASWCECAESDRLERRAQ